MNSFFVNKFTIYYINHFSDQSIINQTDLINYLNKTIFNLPLQFKIGIITISYINNLIFLCSHIVGFKLDQYLKFTANINILNKYILFLKTLTLNFIFDEK